MLDPDTSDVGTSDSDTVGGEAAAGGSASTLTALRDRFSAANLQVLAHFYRGEMNRSNVWRQKMDITSNWAIVSTTAAVSVAFSRTQTELHIIMPFAAMLVFLLLNIEARRYRFFDVWRTRVRMLECHLLVPSLFPEMPLLEGNWRQQLADDLLLPTYKISYWESIARRLQRNYQWIFLLLLVAWLVKVLVQGEDTMTSWASTYEAFAWGALPPWVLLAGMGSFYAGLTIVLVTNLKVRQATGEIRRKDPSRRVWPI